VSAARPIANVNLDAIVRSGTVAEPSDCSLGKPSQEKRLLHRPMYLRNQAKVGIPTARFSRKDCPGCETFYPVPGPGNRRTPRERPHGQGQDAAKLGCVFTQTRVDEEGYAVRDEESTTYAGAIEEAEFFGRRIYAEAIRRGLLRARQVIVLGDEAQWIWGIVEEHFLGAIEIVDLYHAREHLEKVAKLLYGAKGAACQAWISARRDELDEGKVEAVVNATSKRRVRDSQAQKELEKEKEYFRGDAERMRYAKFRSQGLFVGSGVVEAGCKIIFGQRLKLSGMHWTVRGANAIIALRCCQLSGRWEEFWESRAAS
jgi:hypothetical protein